MNVIRSLGQVASAAVLMLAVASPLTSFAHEGAMAEHHPPSAEVRAQWTKTAMEREANWLEIKASQQPAWDAYVAARIDLLNTFEKSQPAAPDIDASATVRQHARRAEAFAQGLSQVADATEKLQAVLDENQRKVLNRIVRTHAQFHHERFGMHGRENECMRDHPHPHKPNADDSRAKSSKPASKASPPKN